MKNAQVNNIPKPLYIPLEWMTIEVRFPGDLRIEQWRAKLQHNHEVKKRYPKLFVPRPNPGDPIQLIPIRFADEAGRNALAVAINSIALTKMDYAGWQSTKEEFLIYWQKLVEELQIEQLNRVGVRFFNRFSSSMWETLAEEPSQPYIWPVYDEKCGFHEARSQLIYNKVTLTVAIQLNRNERNLVIDYDAAEEGASPEDLEDKLDHLHEVIEAHFLSLLKEEFAMKLKPEQGGNKV